MSKHIKIEQVRISYPNLFRPRVSTAYPNAEPKYEATFIVDASSSPNIVPEIQAAIAEAAAAAGFTAGTFKQPPWKQLPDGTMEISTRSSSPIHVVDDYNNVSNEANCKVYPGCRVHAIISVYAYTANGSGITFGLEAVQFAADDQRLDNRPDMAQAFTAIAPQAAVPAAAAPAPMAPPVAPYAPPVAPQPIAAAPVAPVAVAPVAPVAGVAPNFPPPPPIPVAPPLPPGMTLQ